MAFPIQSTRLLRRQVMRGRYQFAQLHDGAGRRIVFVALLADQLPMPGAAFAEHDGEERVLGDLQFGQAEFDDLSPGLAIFGDDRFDRRADLIDHAVIEEIIALNADAQPGHAPVEIGAEIWKPADWRWWDHCHRIRPYPPAAAHCP